MAEWFGDATTDAVFNDVHYYFFKFEIFTAEICIMHKVPQSTILVCENAFTLSRILISTPKKVWY